MERLYPLSLSLSLTLTLSLSLSHPLMKRRLWFSRSLLWSWYVRPFFNCLRENTLGDLIGFQSLDGKGPRARSSIPGISIIQRQNAGEVKKKVAPIPANVLPRHVLRWREDKDWKIENGYTASICQELFANLQIQTKRLRLRTNGLKSHSKQIAVTQSLA